MPIKFVDQLRHKGTTALLQYFCFSEEESWRKSLQPMYWKYRDCTAVSGSTPPSLIVWPWEAKGSLCSNVKHQNKSYLKKSLLLFLGAQLALSVVKKVRDPHTLYEYVTPLVGSRRVPDSWLHGNQGFSLHEGDQAVEDSATEAAPVNQVRKFLKYRYCSCRLTFKTIIDRADPAASYFRGGNRNIGFPQVDGDDCPISRYGKTPSPDQMKTSGGFCPICQASVPPPPELQAASSVFVQNQIRPWIFD